jgi:fatty acid desaturase
MQSIAQDSASVDHIAEFLARAKPKTWYGLCDVFLGGWLRIFMCLALYAWKPCPITFAMTFFGVTSGMGSLVALSHESQHASLLPKKKWNDLIGAWFCAYPIGSVWGTSRAVHLAHHKYLNTPLDPDLHFHLEEDKSTPKDFAMFFLKLLFGGQLWTSFVVNGFLRHADRAKQSDTEAAQSVIVMPKRKYPEVLNLMPVQCVVFNLLWLITGQWWAYFAFWLLPIFTLGTFLGYMRGFIDHARLADDDPVLSANRLISVPNPSIFDRSFLTGLDFEFHAEHHFFPSVPHYFLPELHKILQADPNYKERYLCRPSYQSFLADYWKQICEGRRSPSTHKAKAQRASE